MEVATSVGPLIAVVDDDKSVRFGLSNLLRSVGYSTRLFESAEDILMPTSLDSVAFMVVDIVLSGMSGIELYLRLKAQGINIPTVFISGNAGSDKLIKIYDADAGAVLFLPKPVDTEILLKTIEQILSA